MTFKLVTYLNLIGKIKNVYKTKLQPMYGGTFNDPKNPM